LSRKTIKFTIPSIPPSVNHAYFTTKWGGRVLTKKGKDFKKLVSEIQANDKIEGKIKAEYQLNYGDKRKRDIGNSEKVISDALEGIYFDDDNQIDILILRRLYGPKNPYINVILTEIENGDFRDHNT